MKWVVSRKSKFFINWLTIQIFEWIHPNFEWIATVYTTWKWIKGGTSLRMGKKCHFWIFHLKSSITHAGSPLKFFWPYDKQNPLKMTTEILKNGKNNGYMFRFLALLKSNILLHYFRIFSHNFWDTNKNLVSFCSPNECASSYVAFFLIFDLVCLQSWKICGKNSIFSDF